MERIDGRSHDPKAQYLLRKQVVRGHENGRNRRQIAAEVGLSYRAVCNIVERYLAYGKAGIAPKAKGRQIGQARRLTVEQEAHIQRLIIEKRPEQLKMTFALWSRNAVRQLVASEFGIELPVRTVGHYLKRWGFTPQKPIKRAYEQRPEAVQRWLQETYPQIAQRAKKEGGEIYWGDETAVVNTDVRGRSYAPVGQTPVAYVIGGTREKLSMISAVSNQGLARWMIVDASIDADQLIEFMTALIRDANKKVFLILDNLRVHHSKAVKAWQAEHAHEIELFYLPSYSPELNPDERLNADLKHAIGTRIAARSKAQLKNIASQHMKKIESSPDRIKAYFHDPKCRYAA